MDTIKYHTCPTLVLLKYSMLHSFMFFSQTECIVQIIQSSIENIKAKLYSNRMYIQDQWDLVDFFMSSEKPLFLLSVLNFSDLIHLVILTLQNLTK